MKRFLVFLLTAATLAFSLCSCSKLPFGRPAENAVSVTERTESPTHTGGEGTSEKEVVQKGVSGAWISTVANIDFPSSPTLGADELKKEIDSNFGRRNLRLERPVFAGKTVRGRDISVKDFSVKRIYLRQTERGIAA